MSSAPNFMKTASEVYWGSDINVIKISEEEGCAYTFNPNDEEAIIRKSGQLGQKPGFSRPVFVPNWTHIVNKGPYLPEEHVISKNNGVVKLNDGTLVPISTSIELAISDFVREYVAQGSQLDQEYVQNFKRDLAGLSNRQLILDNLDFSGFNPIIPELDIPRPTGDEHKYAQVDGNLVRLIPYELPVTHVDAEGHIIVGPKEQHVSLNSMEKVGTYIGQFYQKGSQVAGAWDTGTSTGHVFLDFGNPEEWVVEAGEAEESSSAGTDFSGWSALGEQSSGSEGGGYGSGFEEGEEEEGGSFVRPKPQQFRMRSEAEMRLEIPEIVDEKKPSFNTYGDVERSYLPMSYLLNIEEQWAVIFKALKSRFTDIGDLPKVSDHVLEFVANSINFAMTKGVPQIPAAIAIIEYAQQRKVY